VSGPARISRERHAPAEAASWTALREPAPPRWGRAASALREIVDLLLPSRCLGCDDRIPLGTAAEPVCAACHAQMREPPWPRCPRCHFPTGTGRTSESCMACSEWPDALAAARSAVILEHPAERLVHALKYEGWRELAPVMARRMLGLEAPAGGNEPRVVVPVPTTARRRRQRGYNQAALLAAEYALRSGLECVEALERTAGGGSQVSLTPAERRSNVRGAFAAVSAEAGRIRGRHVTLIDDVLTTGATAGEAARALERAGAQGVSLFTFARALPDRRRSRPGGG
jgi:ComF family protein